MTIYDLNKMYCRIINETTNKIVFVFPALVSRYLRALTIYSPVSMDVSYSLLLLLDFLMPIQQIGVLKNPRLRMSTTARIGWMPIQQWRLIMETEDIFHMESVEP